MIVEIALVVIVAKSFGFVAQRLKIPIVLGEIIAGFALGPSLLGWVSPEVHSNTAEVIHKLSELGIILLLVQVGMHTDIAEMRKIGRSAISVAVIGVVIPFVAGFAVATFFAESTNVAIFIGAALTATSVGITARVLGDLKALARREARIILGAAIVDDVLGLVILTVVVRMIDRGHTDFVSVLSTISLAFLFIVVAGFSSFKIVPNVLDRINSRVQSQHLMTLIGLAIALAFASLATTTKLAFIIGAFIAGIGLKLARSGPSIDDGLRPLRHVTIPIFFASIGLYTDLKSVMSWHVFWYFLSLTCVAVIGKMMAAFGAEKAGTNRLLIGIGMIPRGEVGLIFASLGISQGVLTQDLYSAIVLMVMATTLLTPPLLTWRLNSDAQLEAN